MVHKDQLAMQVLRAYKAIRAFKVLLEKIVLSLALQVLWVLPVKLDPKVPLVLMG
jgi:hypothetical protein